MPGIIVSRPIFNTLFKLAHDQGLSINAFLTKLLETSGAESGQHAPVGAAVADEPMEQVVDEGSSTRVASESVRAIEASAPRAMPVRPGVPTQSGDTYIGETEKNVPSVNGHIVNGHVAAGDSAPDDADDEGDGIWKRVVAMEGRKFATSRGKKFTYKVNGEYVIVRDSSARIPRSQFAKAEKMWPVKGPSQLVGVYAPSVVWAIMKEMAAEPVAG